MRKSKTTNTTLAALAALQVALWAPALAPAQEQAGFPDRPGPESAPLPAPNSPWIGPNGTPLPFDSDEEILEFLRTATVTEREKLGTGVTKPHRVVLEKDGIRMRAIFRYFEVETERIWVGKKYHMFFRDSWRSEPAAYVLARLLGIHSVPPATVRRLGNDEGSLQIWVEDAMSNADRIRERIHPPDIQRWILQINVMHVFDNLVYNDDRNPGNVLIDPNWKLWMIDHSRAFQRDSRLRNPEKIGLVERALWERLRTLSDAEIRAAMKGLLGLPEISALLKRRQRLVQHIETLIETRGEDVVLYTLPTS